MASKKVILDLFGGTGAWSRPYKDAGYEVHIITEPKFDVRDFEIRGRHICFKVQGLENHWVSIPLKNIYGILAAPPCTEFSFMRNNSKKPREWDKSLELVDSALKIIWACRMKGSLKFWALENPMGYLRQFIGMPYFKFDPTEFGEAHNKRTDIWGFFRVPRKTHIYKKTFSRAMAHGGKEIPKDYIVPKGVRRDAVARAITPERFAKAFFRANK